jgi:hypothetical protein
LPASYHLRICCEFRQVSTFCSGAPARIRSEEFTHHRENRPIPMRDGPASRACPSSASATRRSNNARWHRREDEVLGPRCSHTAHIRSSRAQSRVRAITGAETCGINEGPRRPKSP